MRQLHAFLACFMLFSSALSAQFMLAGEHLPGQYHVDIEPDTTIVAPFALPITQANWPLDMNGDGGIDFILRVFNNTTPGTSIKYCSVEPLNNNEVALAYQDSCVSYECGFGGLLGINGMVRAFGTGDTISADAQWADSVVYLAYGTFSSGCLMCSSNSFADTGDTYIGLRYFAAADTLYGWVKISNVSVNHPNINQVACTIEAIAGESGTTGTSEARKNNIALRLSPNPASGLARLDFARALPSDAVFEVHDHTGRFVWQQQIAAQTTTTNIDVSLMLPGVYFYTCHATGDWFSSGKLVVAR